MQWGLDAAYPPGGGDAQRLYAWGWRFFGGYVGGRAEHIWTPADWQRVASAGFQLLPIWVAPSTDQPDSVGSDEGNQALEALQANRLEGVVVLDIENGADLTNYTRGFAASVRAGSCRVAIYGTVPTLSSVGLNVETDAWWLAFWPSSPFWDGAAPPDWSLWQYASGEIHDYDVAVDSFKFATLSVTQ